MIDNNLYKNFISQENYRRNKKETSKKENNILIMILIINIIISFKVVNIFTTKDTKEKIRIEYNEKENLIYWIELLNGNVKEAKIDNGIGEILVNKKNINEMLNKFEVENIQLEKDLEVARLKVKGIKYGK